MKKLSDTFVKESKGSARIALQKMDNKKLWDCFVDFLNSEAAVDFLNDCLFSDKASVRDLARKWMVSKLIEENVTMDDLESDGWV